MFPKTRSLVWITSSSLLAVALWATLPAHGDEPKKADSPVTAKEAFAKLKTLVGTWENKMDDKEHHVAASEKNVVYRLTGAGSALIETDFPGSNHEMVSVYHLDHDDLRLTHYCAVGNQPRLKLDRQSSTPSRLVFVFDGGTNFDPDKDMHIHGLTVEFKDDNRVDASWDANDKGKKAATTVFELSRSKP